jgi:hypothetical protein
MRSIVRLLDQSLRKAQGVFEYWADPDCMFRVSYGRAPRLICLPDSEIPDGAKVLFLHFWNEHMPQIPPEGPNLTLAMRAARMLKASFRALAHEIQHNPGLADVKAVGGIGVLIPTPAPEPKSCSGGWGSRSFPTGTPWDVSASSGRTYIPGASSGPSIGSASASAISFGCTAPSCGCP